MFSKHHKTAAILVLACALTACATPESEAPGRPTAEPGSVERVALAPRTSDGDGPLFRRLSSEETGVKFGNKLKPENIKKYLYNGAGLAVGDYDDDGLPDLYLVSQDGPNALFRQVEPWKFVNVTDDAGVTGSIDGNAAWGTGACFVDTDGDGDLDLFVANLGSRDLLYRNDGDGSFTEIGTTSGLAGSRATVAGAFSDYDRDGDLDLYLLTYRLFTVAEEAPNVRLQKVGGEIVVPEQLSEQIFVLDGRLQEAGQRDHLFRNDGSKGFTEVTAEAGITGNDMGLSATWWDPDADGWPDLYVANDYKGPDRWYRNDRDGTFTEITEGTVPHTPWFGMGSDYSDVDGNGRFDLLVADMSARGHVKQKTQMGAMSESAWFLTSAVPRQYMRNALYLNTGTDRFTEGAYLAGLDSTDWTWSPRFGDLDLDGREDLFVTNGMAKNISDSDWKDSLKSASPEEQAASFAALGRLNEPNVAFRNLGDITFEEVSAEWGLDHNGVSHGSVLADLDRDGDLDVVVSNLNEPFAIYRNEGTAGHALLIRLQGYPSNRFGLGARVRAEVGERTIVRYLSSTRGYLSADEPIVHLGLGEARRIDRLTVHWPSGAYTELQDVEADALLTITEPDPKTSQAPSEEADRTWFRDASASSGIDFLHREAEFDDYAREPLLPNKLSQPGPGLAVGDATGDGHDDVFIGGAAGQSGVLYAGRGDGTFRRAQQGPWQSAVDAEDTGAAWIDFDGDGDLDLFVASGGVEADPGSALLNDRLYINGGDGSWSIAGADVLPALSVSSGPVAAADYDGDGDDDLFVGGRTVPGRYPDVPRSRLLRNAGGRFEDVTDVSTSGLARAGLVTGAAWVDSDADGDLDLAVAQELGSLKLFRNQGGRLVDATASAGLSDLMGWWNGVVAGDLDGDGDLDLVASNLGLNTKYKASTDEPISIYAADFDEDGDQDLVEANYDHGEEFPGRGRSCSSAAMPFVAEKFPTYADFAVAPLEEIYEPAKLQQAHTLRARNLESVALINDGKGRFEARPLPRVAQLSPAFGAAIEDLDGDGHADVVLAQNFFAPQPETGNMDGGLSLVLHGHGDGSFEALPAHRSGVVVPQDATAVAVSDLDGDGQKDLVIATTNGPVRVFMGQ